MRICFRTAPLPMRAISTDNTYDHFAIPPIPAYRVLPQSRSTTRSTTTRRPPTSRGTRRTISGATRTFSNASTTAARSHPWLPDLGRRHHGQSHGQPVLARGKLDFPHAARDDHSRREHLRDRRPHATAAPGTTLDQLTLVAAADDTWDVQIPYYPATYYMRRHHLYRCRAEQRRVHRLLPTARSCGATRSRRA